MDNRVETVRPPPPAPGQSRRESLTESTRAAAWQALHDPATPAVELHRIVSVHPDFARTAAAHPNAYPELIAWAGGPQPQVPDAPAARSTGLPVTMPSAVQPPARPGGRPVQQRKPRSLAPLWWSLGGAVAVIVLVIAGVMAIPALLAPSKDSAPITEAQARSIAGTIFEADAVHEISAADARGDWSKLGSGTVPADCGPLSLLGNSILADEQDSHGGSAFRGGPVFEELSWIALRAFPDPESAETHFELFATAAENCPRWTRGDGLTFTGLSGERQSHGDWEVLLIDYGGHSQIGDIGVGFLLRRDNLVVLTESGTNGDDQIENTLLEVIDALDPYFDSE